MGGTVMDGTIKYTGWQREREKRNQAGKCWKIGIYIRLSREDKGELEESESVANQRRMLREYVAGLRDGHTYRIVKEYVDDGISGVTDDERGGFQEMLADIRRGRINCVMVKDLARSFRNYSDQGYYLDDWFPRHNVRFISLFHQPLDSFREPKAMRSIAVPIQGVLNENHCAETSEKVREVFDMKRKRGEHIGSFAVYGYVKDRNHKNTLVVDEEAAQVVRAIFSMFLQGMTKKGIVCRLNDMGIPCPAVYKWERQGLNYCNPHADKSRPPLWSASTVGGILKNAMYCGDMVQGRYRIKSYKVHVQEQVPESEWYVVPNTHEAIIDREQFERVQKLLSEHLHTCSGKRQVSLFSGVLYCGDCGKAMSRSRVKGTVYYYCRTYKDRSKKACTKHTIRHQELEEAVLQAIRTQVERLPDKGELLEQVDREGMGGRIKTEERRREERRRNEEMLTRIFQYRQSAYEDWKDGVLSREEYERMMEAYDQKTKKLKDRIETIQRELEREEQQDSHEASELADFRTYGNFTRLTRAMVTAFIERITVFEEGKIQVGFRFGDGE